MPGPYAIYARRVAEILPLVEAGLRAALGEPDARAAVTFLGADRVEVLRFLDVPPPGPEDRLRGPLVRYATLGMSASPMADPSAAVADPVRGPRAELVLSLRAGVAGTDGVLRPLAVLAASPQVEGVVVAPGQSLDVGAPLWRDAPFASVLVGEPGGLVEDVDLTAVLSAGVEPVRFLPLLPMTHNEAAWKRARGARALLERWLAHGTDLSDPLRGSVPLD
jgi:Suppressor of fused protein (SUFU)